MYVETVYFHLEYCLQKITYSESKLRAQCTLYFTFSYIFFVTPVDFAYALRKSSQEGIHGLR
jgi:hypothetical protein